MMHSKLGFIFDEHTQSGPELVAMEARVMERDHCACHFLALWWQDFLEWEFADVYPSQDQMGFFDARICMAKNITFYLYAQSIDMTFFSRMVTAVSPTSRLYWRKSEPERNRVPFRHMKRR